MFQNIVVIGAGTMGSGIAGQIANAGHPVLLLDLPGDEQANFRAELAVKSLLGSSPPSLMHKDCARLISLGNTRDDFEQLAMADWVVEAIVERLDDKRQLYRRLSKVISDSCLVTSNTSTIPIALLVDGLPVAFQQRFAITHYFNPVRYMRLLELVRGEQTLSTVVNRLADFNDHELGKGVVRCADTPGFLGNRVGVFALQVGMDEAIRHALPIETADALMGRPMGIPKTGVYGLYDLIGVDLMADVVRSLRNILPVDDAFHAVSAENDMINSMISEGLIGKKGRGGFYKFDAAGVRYARSLATGNYYIASSAVPARAAAAAGAIALQKEPLTDLIIGNGPGAAFCRNVLGRVLGYAASLLGNVTDSPQAIDDAMTLGFNWIRGPFEMIDALGAATVRELLAATGAKVPDVLLRDKPFYDVRDGLLLMRGAHDDLLPVKLPIGVVRFNTQRRTLTPLMRNECASLYAIENDYRLIEFHSKANALTDQSMAVVAHAALDAGNGVVVHNDAQHFSAGVDLNAFLRFIDTGDWSGIDRFLTEFQQAVKSLKYTNVPTVGAPSGLSLGGGLEVLLHCDQLVLHANSVLGLVESGVGLVPAGGGIKETYLRWYAVTGDWQKAAWKSWLNLAYGASGSSPVLAEKLGYFRSAIDNSVMNRDRLYTAAVAALDKLSPNYQAPAEPVVVLAGGDILERMRVFMEKGIRKGDFFAHDKTTAMQIGGVMCSENGVEKAVSEDDFYARERAAFIHLAQTPQTGERIRQMLLNGAVLRN